MASTNQQLLWKENRQAEVQSNSKVRDWTVNDTKIEGTAIFCFEGDKYFEELEIQVKSKICNDEKNIE